MNKNLCQTLQLSENFLTTDLVQTSNSLLDIINWIKLGAYVILHTNKARFFHICKGKTLSEDEMEEYINTHKFVYVNVSKFPRVLDDKEWNLCIKNQGVDECKCSIKRIASNTKETLPYCEKLAIDMQNMQNYLFQNF